MNGSLQVPAPALSHDPVLAETTFVVLDFEGTTPRGYSPEPIEVAALALRRDGDRWRRAWSFEALMKPPYWKPADRCATSVVRHGTDDAIRSVRCTSTTS